MATSSLSHSQPDSTQFRTVQFTPHRYSMWLTLRGQRRMVWLTLRGQRRMVGECCLYAAEVVGE